MQIIRHSSQVIRRNTNFLSLLLLRSRTCLVLFSLRLLCLRRSLLLSLSRLSLLLFLCFSLSPLLLRYELYRVRDLDLFLSCEWQLLLLLLSLSLVLLFNKIIVIAVCYKFYLYSKIANLFFSFSLKTNLRSVLEVTDPLVGLNTLFVILSLVRLNDGDLSWGGVGLKVGVLFSSLVLSDNSPSSIFAAFAFCLFSIALTVSL